MFARRNARLRREYLYRKGLQGKEKEHYERKRKVQRALEEGIAVPTELKRDAAAIKQALEYDDVNTAEVRNAIDDEYANAGSIPPKILVTTARTPSSRLMQFAKELRLVFPNAQTINRGNTVVKELVHVARQNDFTDVIVVHEHRGKPDGLIVSHLPYGPTAYFALSNCVLRHDLHERAAPVSEVFPHLIFHEFETKLGLRVRDILRFLFPVPKQESKRVITFANQSDFISFRHHTFDKRAKTVELHEQGPRFEMRLYQIRLGTLDMKDADNEWVLRPYMNTAHKRRRL